MSGRVHSFPEISRLVERGFANSRMSELDHQSGKFKFPTFSFYGDVRVLEGEKIFFASQRRSLNSSRNWWRVFSLRQKGEALSSLDRVEKMLLQIFLIHKVKKLRYKYKISCLPQKSKVKSDKYLVSVRFLGKLKKKCFGNVNPSFQVGFWLCGMRQIEWRHRGGTLAEVAI